MSLRFALVDDNEQDRVLVVRELRRAFPEPAFQEIFDRKGFDRLLQSGAFDVVITDYQLGWGTGLEVFGAVRSRFPDTPVIMFTGSGSEETAVEAMKSGLDDYVIKRPSHFLRVPASVRLALARRRADRELYEHREWLSAILRNISEGVIATDDSGRIRFLNAAAERITGWSREEALGCPIESLFEVHNENGGVIGDTPARRALRGDPDASQQSGLILTRRDGRHVSIIDGACPIRDVLGRISGAVVTFRDITERKRTRRELERALEEIEQFTYAAAHDLREPLRSVSIFTELLTRDYRQALPAEAGELARHIIQGSQRMEALISGLIEYGEVERAELHFEKISPEEVLEGVAARLKPSLEETGAELRWENLPAVESDASQLSRIFRNLIRNAIDHRGASAPRVAVSVEAKADEWIFRVADNGPGIPARHRERIFQVFQRLRRDHGAGIGLTVVRRAVERLGGRIWVDSEEGRGSRFYFSLPRDGREQ